MLLEEAYPDVPMHTVQVSTSVSHSEHKFPQTKKKKIIFYLFNLL